MAKSVNPPVKKKILSGQEAAGSPTSKIGECGSLTQVTPISPKFPH
jgi:hypothetical protein